MRNLVYICVFCQKDYIGLLKLLLISVFLFGDVDYNTTDIVVMTDLPLIEEISAATKYLNIPFKFFIRTADSVFESGCARLHIFKYANIGIYDKILYLDTDILVGKSLSTILDLDIDPEKLYAVEEGNLHTPYHGGYFYSSDCNINLDQTAFSSGILFFKNSLGMKNLFSDILKHIHTDTVINKNPHPGCLDQPYIVYNSVIQNKYNNQLLKSLSVVGDPQEENENIVLYHFMGNLGSAYLKGIRMNLFLNKMIERCMTTPYSGPSLFERRKTYDWIEDNGSVSGRLYFDKSNFTCPFPGDTSYKQISENHLVVGFGGRIHLFTVDDNIISIRIPDMNICTGNRVLNQEV